MFTSLVVTLHFNVVRGDYIIPAVHVTRHGSGRPLKWIDKYFYSAGWGGSYLTRIVRTRESSADQAESELTQTS